MIIGITGSFGAGKGAVVDYLKQKGFAHFSARSFLVGELEKRNIPFDRDSITVLANQLRAEHGSTFIIEQLMQQAAASGRDAVIESLRAKAEVEYVQQEGGIVLGVDAPAHIRFDRVIKRGSETDHVSYEKWKEQEEKESNPDDPNKQDIFGALELSDVIIQNDGSIEALHKNVDRFLEQFS